MGAVARPGCRAPGSRVAHAWVTRGSRVAVGGRGGRRGAHDRGDQGVVLGRRDVPARGEPAARVAVRDTAVRVGERVGAHRATVPDMEVSIRQFYARVLYPHIVRSAYGERLSPDLAERLVERGVDMFLGYYRKG